MRPSSPDPNSPYRAAIASLADCNFFTDKQVEEPDSANTLSQPPSFAGLLPRSTTYGIVPNAASNIATSSAPITILTLQRYLIEKGYSANRFLADATVQMRLQSGNISAETLLVALQIAHNPNHSLLNRFRVSNQEREELIYRLAGITTNDAGFHQAIRTEIRNAQNNPEQLVTNLLEYLRYH